MLGNNLRKATIVGLFSTLFILVVTVVSDIYWEDNPVDDSKWYGNTFIKLDDSSTFHYPSVEHHFMDSSFVLSIPCYMEERCFDGTRLLSENEAVFRYDDIQTLGEQKYGRIWIEYTKVKAGEANLPTDYIDVYEQKNNKFLRSLVDAAIGNTENSASRKNGVPVGKIVNGPFYQCLKIGEMDGQPVYALDAFYRREGHTEGKGPVSCHIFFIQNYDEVVRITMSHHDTDSVSFRDLFKSIKTFRWNKNHISSHYTAMFDNRILYNIALPKTLELQNSELYGIEKEEMQDSTICVRTLSPSNHLVFQQRGLNTNDEFANNQYCRVIINYYKEDKPVYHQGDQILIGAGMLCHITEMVQDSCRRNNTPFLELLDFQSLTINGFPVLFYSYRREGWKGKPPVIVNIYQIFNGYESADLTFSYREAERDNWQNIHNYIIKTFKFSSIY